LAKKIRVYELARELGLTNKEALDLCIDLGIGVKSHSSSIEDAQADRVRRKADQLGLRREVQPEEPEPTKPARPVKAAAKPVEPSASVSFQRWFPFLAFPLGAILLVGAWWFHKDVNRKRT